MVSWDLLQTHSHYPFPIRTFETSIKLNPGHASCWPLMKKARILLSKEDIKDPWKSLDTIRTTESWTAWLTLLFWPLITAFVRLSSNHNVPDKDTESRQCREREITKASQLKRLIWIQESMKDFEDRGFWSGNCRRTHKPVSGLIWTGVRITCWWVSPARWHHGNRSIAVTPAGASRQLLPTGRNDQRQLKENLK